MLAEADFDTTALAFQQPNDADKRLRAMFYMNSVQDMPASQKEGRPIYKDVEYITIAVPGDKDSIIQRAATDIDRQRFAAQYMAFKQKQNQDTVAGTPLKMWPAIARSQVLELEYFNVFTVEQLADMADSNAQNFMGIQKLRKLAQDWLKAAKDNAFIGQLNAELEKRDNELQVANRTIKDLAARLEVLERKVDK